MASHYQAERTGSGLLYDASILKHYFDAPFDFTIQMNPCRTINIDCY